MIASRYDFSRYLLKKSYIFGDDVDAGTNNEKEGLVVHGAVDRCIGSFFKTWCRSSLLGLILLVGVVLSPKLTAIRSET